MARTPARRATPAVDDETVDAVMAHLADLVTTEKMLRTLHARPLESVGLVTMAVLYMQASDPAHVLRTVKAVIRRREARVARLTEKRKPRAKAKGKRR